MQCFLFTLHTLFIGWNLHMFVWFPSIWLSCTSECAGKELWPQCDSKLTLHSYFRRWHYIAFCSLSTSWNCLVFVFFANVVSDGWISWLKVAKSCTKVTFSCHLSLIKLHLSKIVGPTSCVMLYHQSQFLMDIFLYDLHIKLQKEGTGTQKHLWKKDDSIHNWHVILWHMNLYGKPP